MKKYEKIMGVFTTAIAELDNLIEGNNKKATVLKDKATALQDKVENKVAVIGCKVLDFDKEASAAKATIEKLKDLLA